MTSLRSTLRSRDALGWLCAALAAFVLVLSGPGTGDADDLSSPIVALATVDLEPSDLDLDLPVIRATQSSASAIWPDEPHERSPQQRPATRTPVPPDRPPRRA